MPHNQTINRPKVVDEFLDLGPVSKHGINLKWDLTQISERLIAGQKFIVFSLKEYHSIFRTMERKTKGLDISDTHMLKRKAIGEEKFAIAWLPNDETLDGVERDPDFNTNYGKYKEQAKLLVNGGQVWHPTMKACRSVSYAWRTNYSAEDRKGWYAKTHKLDEEDYQAAVDAGIAEDIDFSEAEDYGYLIFLAPTT